MELKNLSVQLKGISGQVLDEIPDRSKPLNIHVVHKVKIERVKGSKTYRYYLSTDVAPKPVTLFTCQVDQLIQVEFAQGLKDEKAEELAYDLCSQAANQLSFLIAMITRELIDTPIMIPPSLNRESFEVLSERGYGD